MMALPGMVGLKMNWPLHVLAMRVRRKRLRAVLSLHGIRPSQQVQHQSDEAHISTMVVTSPGLLWVVHRAPWSVLHARWQSRILSG